MLSYESFRVWRSICEFLFAKYGNNRSTNVASSKTIISTVPDAKGFVDFDTEKRDELKQAVGFSLIAFKKFSSRKKGWYLKEYWEEKLWFLEQVILFNRNPSDLPRPWDAAELVKNYEKHFVTELQEISTALGSLVWLLESLENVDGEPEELIRLRLRSIVRTANKARGSLFSLPELKEGYKLPSRPRLKNVIQNGRHE